MTNQDALFESFVNVPHYILNKELKPLCLVHLIWLNHVDSPLLNTALPLELSDLEIAALICSSSSHEEIIEKLKPKSRFSKVKRYLWRVKNKKANLDNEVLKWLYYYSDNAALPNYGNRKEVEEILPFFILQIASLIKYTGWSEADVMLMPIGKACWYSSAFSYMETGKTSIMSDTESYMMNMWEEIQGN